MKFILQSLNSCLGKMILSKPYHQNDRSLSKIVSDIIPSFQPLVAKQASQLVNTIPTNIRLFKEPKLIRSIIERLLQAMILYGRETTLSLHADSHQDVLSIYIKGTRTYNGYAIHSQFEELQLMANEIDGVLGLESARNKETIISLTFLNKSV